MEHAQRQCWARIGDPSGPIPPPPPFPPPPAGTRDGQMTTFPGGRSCRQRAVSAHVLRDEGAMEAREKEMARLGELAKTLALGSGSDEAARGAAQEVAELFFIRGVDARREASAAVDLSHTMAPLLRMPLGNAYLVRASRAVADVTAGSFAMKEAAVAANALKALVRVLEGAEEAGPEVVENAALAVGNIAGGSGALREAASAAGAGPALARALALVAPGSAAAAAVAQASEAVSRGGTSAQGGVAFARVEAAVASGVLPGLVRVLSDGEPASASVREAARAVGNLGWTSKVAKEAAVAAGALPALARVLAEADAGSEGAGNAAWAVAALIPPSCPSPTKDAAVAAGVLPGLVRVLSGAAPDSHGARQAARALGNLQCSLFVRGCNVRREAAVAAGAIPALVKLLSGAEPGSERAENAAWGVAMFSVKAAAVAAVPSLTRVLEGASPESPNARHAAFALHNVCLHAEHGKQAVLAAGAVAPLLRMAECAHDQSADKAVFVLLRMAQHPPARPELSRHDAVRRLVAKEGHTAALLAALTVGGTEEAERLVGDPRTLRDAALYLGEKVEHDATRFILRLSDWMSGVAMLTVNEANKRALAQECGIVPLLLRVLEADHPSSLDVKADAAQALWNLALTDDVRTSMEATHGVLARMREAREAFRDAGPSGGPLLRHIHGVLFEYEGRTPSVSGAAASRWVLISYNWGSQDLALYLSARLKALGLAVWIDVECMAGDVINAMAEAVEGAAAVVTIMTMAYKQSPNCQSELKYTHKLGKPIVPLAAQGGYAPDGWLARILDGRPCFDFCAREQWDAAMEAIVPALDTHHHRVAASVSSEARPARSPSGRRVVVIVNASQDRTLGAYLGQELEARRFEVWTAARGSLDGIAYAMDAACAVVCVATRAAKRCVRCHAQLSLARELGVPIVPAMAEVGCAPGGWLGLLCGDRLYFSFRDRSAWDSSAEAIAGELERCAQAAAMASADAGRRRATARPAGPVMSAARHDEAPGTTSSTGLVVISHELRDSEAAHGLARALAAVGLDVWVGAQRLSGAAALAPDEVAEALEGASVVVCLVTRAYKDSLDCEEELKYAKKLRKPIVPVLAEDGYSPDAWLGLILDDQPAFDLTTSHEALVERLLDEGRAADATSPSADGGERGVDGARRDGVACATCSASAGHDLDFCTACGARRTPCPACADGGGGGSEGRGRPFCGTCGRREQQRPHEAIAYAESHGVRDAVTRALCAVLSTRPTDPLRVMAAALNEAAAHPARVPVEPCLI